MSKRAVLGLATVIALQALWVIGTATTKEIAHANGQHILLATRPVDPRDLLRGDYLILNYDVSTIKRNRVRGAIPTDPIGKHIYVALVPSGKLHQLDFASFAPISPGNGRVVVRGTVDERFQWVRSGDALEKEKRDLSVVYGLERYYVPEGRGNPKGELTVEISVTSGGEPLIRELFVEGKPFADTKP